MTSNPVRRSACILAALALAASVVLTGCQSTPPAGAAADPALAARAAEDPDKLVCKSEPVTGTRLTRKVCYTQQELDMARQNSREQVEEIKRQGNRPPGS